MARISWVFRLTFAVARFLERLGRVWLFAGAGTLTRRDLLVVSRQWWQEFSSDSREVLRGFKSWEQDVNDRFVRPGDRILVVGSGTGRDTIAFSRAGHEVVGVEPVAEALAVARRACADHQITASFVEAQIEDAALPGAFDVVVFSWFTYCYIPGSAFRIGALTRLAPHLTPGARLVITYLSATAPLTTYAVRVARLTARLSGSDWHPEPGDVLRESEGQLRFEHRFTSAEIAHEVVRAGYRIVWDRQWPEMPTLVLMRDDAGRAADSARRIE